MRRVMLLVCAIVLSTVLVTGASGSAGSVNGRWVIRDLGTLGGKFSIAYAINERGQVVGTSRTSSGEQHVFLWQGGNMSDLGRYIGMGSIRVNDQGQVVWAERGRTSVLWENGVATRIGISANAINGRGQIAGSIQRPDDRYHAALWENGRVRDLGVLPGDKDSGAIAINDSGAVVGSSMIDYNRRRAFLWRDGVMHDLGRLPGFQGCEATAINNSGHVLGYCTDEHRLHTFLWHDGHMQDLGVIGQGGPGTGSAVREWAYPEVLNDRDQIVVRTRSSVGGNDRPSLWQGGKFTELGTLPGGEHEYLWGEAINNHGQVIGSSTNQQSETFFTRAYLWQDGAMTNIGHGRASTAMDINDRGQIVGYRGTGGRYEGYPVLHAVLWTLRSG